MPLESRNNTFGFASRTLKNLEYIRNAFVNDKADVHPVTQLVSSLLGLIVVPWERRLEDNVPEVKLEELDNQGWRMWTITLDDKETPTLTLERLIYHIRNAIAHGRFTFTSDSRLLSQVMLEVEDRKGPSENPYWRAEIRGDCLYSFCCRFAQYMENSKYLGT